MVGHGEKFYEKIFDTPLEAIEKPYGAFMKAESRRRTHTIGAKWLVQPGRKILASPTTEEKGKDGSRTDGINRGKVVSSCGVLGNRDNAKAIKDMVVIDENLRDREDNGVKIATEGNSKYLKNSMDLNETNGLFIMDQKRRRVEVSDMESPNNVESPIDNNAADDTDMVDSQKM